MGTTFNFICRPEPIATGGNCQEVIKVDLITMRKGFQLERNINCHAGSKPRLNVSPEEMKPAYNYYLYYVYIYDHVVGLHTIVYLSELIQDSCDWKSSAAGSCLGIFKV